jgi:NAD(P)-dependent dehydrogenase (short-subunit alcohol dehydrogenase family)
MVTGATNGMGLIAARELAKLGARVVVVSRNQQKCVTVAEQIKSQTGNTQVEYIAVDLSSRAGIQQAAHEFKKQHTRLDVLLNNAGAIYMSRQLSKDNIELTFALNHLNYFHLTILLLDVLKASGSARIVNVASDMHRSHKLNFDDLQAEKSYNGMAVYGRSKLANVLFTYELARKLEGTKVTANALHPGFVSTGFGKNNGKLMKIVLGLLSPIQREPEEGAATSVYLASAPEVQGVSGKYFVDCKPVDSDPVTYDRPTAEKLWQASLEMIV